MKTTILHLNEKASEVVSYLMDPEILDNRITLFEQITDMCLEFANGTTETDDSKLLHLVTEFRFLSRDFRTIRNSLKENCDHGQG